MSFDLKHTTYTLRSRLRENSFAQVDYRFQQNNLGHQEVNIWEQEPNDSRWRHITALTIKAAQNHWQRHVDAGYNRVR